MKYVHPKPHVSTEVLYHGRNPVLPPHYRPTPGMLIWRDSKHTVSWWNGREWFRLNSAGWAITFVSPFPENIPVGHWAVLGPVLFRRRGNWFQQQLTAQTIQWAMACPTPTGKFLNPEPAASA